LVVAVRPPAEAVTVIVRSEESPAVESEVVAAPPAPEFTD
jgi:hypothetical protein